MSRSVRRHPITGVTTARSEKDDKRRANRRFRRRARRAEEAPRREECSDAFSFGKDGKRYYGWTEHTTKFLRK